MPFTKVSDPKLSAPPRTTRTTTKTASTVDLIPLDKLAPAIEMQYDSIAAMLLPLYPATAMQITDDSHKIADTYCEVAKRSPQFHRAISKMLNSAGMMTIIAVHANIAMAAYAEQRVPKTERFARAMEIGSEKIPSTQTTVNAAA
jgi:hypothetical protein